jgi:hypothetical protein
MYQRLGEHRGHLPVTGVPMGLGRLAWGLGDVAPRASYIAQRRSIVACRWRHRRHPVTPSPAQAREPARGDDSSPSLSHSNTRKQRGRAYHWQQRHGRPALQLPTTPALPGPDSSVAPSHTSQGSLSPCLSPSLSLSGLLGHTPGSHPFANRKAERGYVVYHVCVHCGNRNKRVPNLWGEQYSVLGYWVLN